jgi:ankyrin repeat protein
MYVCVVLLVMAGRLGWTALHYACERGQLDTARLLLCYNADGCAANVYGESPMHYAASGGHEALVGLMATQAGHTGKPTTRAQVRSVRLPQDSLSFGGPDVF